MASTEPTRPGAGAAPPYTKADLPHRITAARFADALRELRENLRGSLREGGAVARIAVIFERFMWEIAKGDDFDARVAPTACELGLALDELDDEIAGLQARPETTADPEQLAQRERDLAAAQSALATLTASMRDVKRDLASERAAREAAERARDDASQRALAALQAEHTGVAQAITTLTELIAKAGAAHAAIDDVLTTTVATARVSVSPSPASQHATLTARLRVLDAWVRRIDERQQAVAEDLSTIPDEEHRLQALLRTGGASTETQRELAALTDWQRTLEEHSRALIEAKRPVEEERNRIRELLRALELAAIPAPERVSLAEIPDYPTPPDSSTVVLPPEGTATGPGVELAEHDALASPLAMHIAVVLYELVRRRIGPEPRTVYWVTKCAEEAGILTRHGLSYWPFSKSVLAETHKTLCARYLKYRGTPGGAKRNTLFTRTAELVPPEWGQLVTDAERATFIAKVQERIAARAAEKAAKAAER